MTATASLTRKPPPPSRTSGAHGSDTPRAHGTNSGSYTANKEGRFYAFSLGDTVQWRTTYKANDENHQYTITGHRTDPTHFDLTEPVVMADGAFIAGSTLELSCDAPLRAPFEVYLQGGLDAAHGVLAVMSAASAVERAGPHAL